VSNRLSKIYTRTGDDGTTGLADGSRLDKDAVRVEAMGDVDELNSLVGLMLTEVLPDKLRAMLSSIQHDLFDIGGELSLPGHTLIADAHVARLERELETLNATLEPLKDFILPGGSRAAATAHVARTVCRRAERKIVTLSRSDNVSPLLLQYLNRLSDLLFVCARVINREAGGADVLWEQGRSRTG
jgi:cob(I)alamin adenosyltransferase